MTKIKEKSGYKLVRHTLVYFLEILIATTAIMYFFEGKNFISNNVYELFKGYAFSYTIYQLIIIAIFKLKDSLKIDVLTNLKNIIDKLQLYAEFEKDIPQNYIDRLRNLINSSEVVIHRNHREFMMQILELIDKYNRKEIATDDFRFILKQESREMDFQVKILGLHWMNSIFLRILK